jgi:hypothetical protein
MSTPENCSANIAMNTNIRSKLAWRIARSCTAIFCSVLLMPWHAFLLAQSQQQGSAPAAATKIPPEQLDSLLAPIALYPDPLLAQTLAASTYPLEVIQLQQWLQKK